MTILCYHSVDPEWTSSPLAISPQAFAGQCRLLASTRRVLPLTQAVSRLDRSGRLGRGQAAVTFDDGFAALYQHAFPLLLRHGLPATVFLVAETLTPAGRAVNWVDTPPPYPLATLDVDQVLEMQAAGVGFASHSFSHLDLTQLTYAECVADLRRSRELLEDLLGRPVPFLAYPRGRNNEVVRQAAERAGYSHAFTLPEQSEPNGPYGVPRVGVYPGNGTLALRVKLQRSYLSGRHSRIFPLLRRVGGRTVGRSG